MHENDLLSFLAGDEFAGTQTASRCEEAQVFRLPGEKKVSS